MNSEITSNSPHVPHSAGEGVAADHIDAIFKNKSNNMTAEIATDIASYDVAISGGGMTGAVLAAVLQRQCPQLRVALIEQQALATAQAAPTQSFDSRSIALSAASVALLQHYGLWQQHFSAASAAILAIEVSDQGHFGKSRLTPQQLAFFGQVIELDVIGQSLYERLAAVASEMPSAAASSSANSAASSAASSATSSETLSPDSTPSATPPGASSPAGVLHRYQPAQINALHTTTDWQVLTLTDGRRLRAKLLVLAEGGQSQSLALTKISSRQQSYGQTAVIANLALDRPHQGVAFERFTRGGPVALLPLCRQRYSLVWTLTDNQAHEVMQLADDDFLARIQQLCGYRAGRFTAVSPRSSYPLQLRQSSAASQHRLVLCGNSLHSLHPVAGQGFNLALRDIAALVHLIEAEVHACGAPQLLPPESRTPDVGAYAITAGYAKARQQDVAQTVLITDGLVKLFSNDSRSLALLRSMGLSVLQQCPELQHAFVLQMSGFAPWHRSRHATI
jgi:2-octaprenyl-6-methoxyphenol hydroxylase